MTANAHSKGPTRRLVLAAGVGGLLGMPAIARGQDNWPDRPIRVIVPFATGGGTDVSMRLIAPKLGEVLGQNVIVENRPGAGSTLGTDFVAKSEPDGYTFVLATLSSTGIAATLYPNLSYDPVNDLTAVAPTVFIPTSVAVTAQGWDVQTLDDFVAELKAQPNMYSYGSSGIGSTGHIASANFLRHVDAQAEHIPYNGAGASFNALVAGETQFTHDIPSLLKPFHQSGQAKVLFVNQSERSVLLPDVPTAEEVGLPDYKAYSWYGIFGPANLPESVVERMAAAIEQVVSDQAVSGRLNELGMPPMVGWSPERFSQYVADEVEDWRPLVLASGARAD